MVYVTERHAPKDGIGLNPGEWATNGDVMLTVAMPGASDLQEAGGGRGPIRTGDFQNMIDNRTARAFDPIRRIFCGRLGDGRHQTLLGESCNY